MTSLIQRNGWHRKWYYQNKQELFKHTLIKDFLKSPEKYTIEYRLRKENIEPQLKLL